MPSEKITKQYDQRTFNDEFNIAHPVFQWLYRVTFNWTAVSDLVPAMREHLRSVGLFKGPTRPITSASSGDGWDQDEASEDYSVLFREHFCVAASELAEDLKVPLSEMGILFNRIMMTGSLAADFQSRRKTFQNTKDTETDVESGIIKPPIFGRGQLLFLARQADKHEAQRLVNEGFRFAYVQQVSEIIARSMQVQQAELISTIESLHKYCQQSSPALTASSYLACFALRASVKASNGGWDVLVPTACPSQLPMVPLSHEPILQWQQKTLNRLDGLSVNQCLSFLKNIISEADSPDGKEWVETLLDKITALAVEVPEQFFGHALFCSRPVSAPSTSSFSNAPSTAQFYAFCTIPDVHVASVKSTHKLTYIPLSFFRTSQRVHSHSPDHAILARKIHREFAAILSNPQFAGSTAAMPSRHPSTDDKGSSLTIDSYPLPTDDRDTKRRSFFPLRFSLPARPPPALAEDSSGRGLVDGTATTRDETSVDIVKALPPPFGGIMVSSDTTVEVQVRAKEDIELANLVGVRAEAGPGANEEPTFVDELYKIAGAMWQRP